MNGHCLIVIYNSKYNNGGRKVYSSECLGKRDKDG